MTKSRRCGRRAAAVALALAVAACSGSGGGGATGKGLTVTPASLTFKASRLTTSVSTMLSVAITDASVAGVVVAYPPGTAAPSWLGVEVADTGNPTRFWVDVFPGVVPVGTYRSTLRVVAVRADQSVLGYVDVPVTFDVTKAPVDATPDRLVFRQAAGGAAPPAQSLALAASGDSYGWTATAEYAEGSGWLRLNGGSAASGAALPASLPVSVQNGSGLAVGDYHASITLAGGGQTRTVPVTLEVRPSQPTVSPAPLSFSIGPATTAPALARTVTVGATGGPVSWTATSTLPWVSVLPASGTSGTDVQVSLDAGALEGLANGTHTATLTFTPAGAGESATVQVTIDVHLPRVDQVAPYVAYTGQAKPVVVRGSGFAGASGLGVEFGSGAGAGVTVLTDTELQVTPPSNLTTGRHRVRLVGGNALGLDRSAADLVIVDAAPHTAGFISNSGTRERLVYDAERRCLYAANPAAGVIQRFCDSGVAWTSSICAVAGVRDIALTPDGKQLVAVSADTLYRVDVATFAVVWSQTGEQLGLGWADKDRLSSVVVTNDAQAMVLVGDYWYQLYRYDLAAGGAFQYVSRFSVAGASEPSDLGISLNGDRVVSGDATSSPANFGVYDATDRTVITPDASVVYVVSLDRTGNRIGAAGEIYDGTFMPLGYAGNWRMTVSPDGNRAYSLDTISTTPPAPAVRSYDISGGSVTELGAASITNPGTATGAANLMLVSLDGGTLFVDGPSGIVVMPAP